MSNKDSLWVVEQYISDRLFYTTYSYKNRAIYELRYKFGSVYKYCRQYFHYETALFIFVHAVFIGPRSIWNMPLWIALRVNSMGQMLRYNKKSTVAKGRYKHQGQGHFSVPNKCLKIFKPYLSKKINTIMTLSFRTDRSGQTVLTQIRAVW